MHNKVQRGGAAIAAISLLFTVLGGLLLPSTAGAAVTRLGGVKGITLNGTGGGTGLSYLGLYKVFNPVSNSNNDAICIEWEGAAPSNGKGDYTAGPKSIDPLLGALAWQIRPENLPTQWKNDENILAAVAAVAKYRSSQLGLPGATSYPVGLPDPTSAADFRLGGSNVTTYNGNAPTTPAVVGNWAMFVWEAASSNAINGSWEKISETAVDGTDGKNIDVVWRFKGTTTVGGNQPVATRTYTLPAALNSNVSSATPMVPGFTGPFPGGSGFTDAQGRAYVRYKVADGSKTTKYGISGKTASAAQVLNPKKSSEQTMVVAGPTVTATLSAQQVAPLGTMRIGKLDAVSGASIAGATLQLKGPSFPNGKNYTSTAGLVDVQVKPGKYTLTETKAPPGYITETPLPSVSGTLAAGKSLTLQVKNYKVIGGATTASETMVVSDGSTEIYDEVTVTGVTPDQEVELRVDFYLHEDLSTTPLTVDLAKDICKAGTPTQTKTVKVKGPGPHKVGPFSIPDGFRGVTTFKDGVKGAGPQSWVDACGQPKETTVVYPPIKGETTASETVITSDGDTEIYDEVSVTGVADGEEVDIKVDFYLEENLTASPLTVDLAKDICESGEPDQTKTVTVKGPGPHKVGPFMIPDGFRGVTTFKDGIKGSDGRFWLDACGQVKETTVVYPVIKGSTQALDTDPAGDKEPGSEIVSEDGAQVWDRVDVIGLAEGETAEVTAQLFQDPAQKFPFEEGFSAEACDPKNLIGEPITVTVTGKGASTETDTVTVGPFAIPAGSEGKVSFLDKVTSTTGDGDRENTRTWEDTCGNPTETLIVRKPIEAKTKVSETFIVSDDQAKVYDVVETNLNEGETATLVAEVHGVYPVDHVFAEGNDDCSADSLLSTFTMDVEGPGPHKVGPYPTDANAEGLITWQDGLKATVGEDQREWLDGCGTPEETSKVRRPLKGSTQASHREVTNTGDVELFDEIVIEGIRDNETATVTANIYGPYDKMPNPDQCGKGELLESFEVEVTGPGPHRVGPYKVPADMVGFVTWQDGVEHEDGRVWLDGCGRVTETTEIKAPQEPETPPTTVPETPPTTVTPDTPDKTTQTTQTTVKPVAPSNPDQPSTPSKPAPPTTNLAYTGGSILLALVAGGLLLSGFVLVRRRKGVSAD